MTRAVTTEAISEPGEDIETTVDRHCETFMEWVSSNGRDVGYEPGELGTVEELLDGELTSPPYETEDVVAAVGCYVGEVCRRSCGGEWYDSPNHGLCVRVGDVATNPFAWVQACLGDEGSLTGFYEDFERRTPPTPS